MYRPTPAVNSFRLSLSGAGGGSDDEVVGSSWSALTTHGYQEVGTCGGDRRVVIDDGDNAFYVVDELLAGWPAGAVGRQDADQ